MKTRHLHPFILVLFWLLLTAAILMLGYLTLRACGIRVLGYEISWCPGTMMSADEQRKDGLTFELKALERQYRQLPLCTAAPSQQSSRSQQGIPLLNKPPAGLDPGVAPSLAGPGGLGGRSIFENGQNLMPGEEMGKPSMNSQGGRNDVEPQADIGSSSGSQSRASNDANPDLGHGNTADQTPQNADQTAQSPENSQVAEYGGTCGPDSEDTSSEIVLALDHSKSMALPVDVDNDVATDLESLMEQATPQGRAAAEEYNAYIARPGTKRLDLLKDAVEHAVSGLPAETDVGLVTFAGCTGVVDAGVFDASQRDVLISNVEALVAKPATPAAEALDKAFSLANRIGSRRIILISDGRDTCNGDPCAIARQSSGVQVDVISMGGGQVLSCIAEATGGRLVESNAGQSLRSVLSELSRNERPSC